MADLPPFLTDAQREIASTLAHDLRQWIAGEFSKTPEEQRTDLLTFMQGKCEEMNASSLEERLRVLAAIHGTTYESVATSVSEVSYRCEFQDGVATLVTSVRMTRSIEAVYMTVTVE